VLANGSLLERAIGALADFSRVHSDGIIVLGACMEERLAARRIPRAKSFIVENWGDSSIIAPRPAPPGLPLTLLYSGNLGLPHDVNTIWEAIRQLRDPNQFRFVFAGSGSRRAALEICCREHGVQNADFLPFQLEEQLSEHFGKCHIGLVTQHPATWGTVVPSKTYAFLSASRPFLFVGPRGVTPCRIIDRYQCGWYVEPGDVSSLVSLLRRLAAQPDLVQAAGERAHQAFLEQYDRSAGVSKVIGVLTARDSAPRAIAATPALTDF
jgi:glycosyltransferase involved in cell wall biosynthesis